MLSNKVQAIVLAAGKSVRFKTGRTKLLEKICGQEMILYSTRLLEKLDIPTAMVVGYQKDSIIQIVKKRHKDFVTFIVQEEQKGTGHAVQCTMPIWEREYILIMNGDMPLVTEDVIQELYQHHINTKAEMSFVISHYEEKSSYGRVITSEKGLKIVEAKDLTGDTNEYCWINAGIYLVNRQFLQDQITAIDPSKQTQEFYLTKLVEMAVEKGYTVSTIAAPFDKIRGINNFQELWAAEHIKRAELVKCWMENGVHFSAAHNVQIDLDVIIGAGSSIGSGAHLLGQTRIGKNCKIGEFSSLENAVLGDSNQVLAHCVINNSTIASQVQVGPFAYIRDKSTINDYAVIGNFVEVTRTSIGTGTKAKHLAYLGDAEIGSNVNIGAGTITCNHNGNTKNKTIIGDRAFIGSNNTLVAPVTIEKNAYTAAGSVITDNVPAEALAIARARQINKENYVHRLRSSSSTTPPSSSGNTSGTRAISFLGTQKNNILSSLEPQ